MHSARRLVSGSLTRMAEVLNHASAIDSTDSRSEEKRASGPLSHFGREKVASCVRL